MESGSVHRDAIHLALDQDGVFEFADGFLGVVQIEQHARLRVDARLGRIQVLGPGFFVGRERAPGKSDDFALVVRDREHHAVAELGVHGGSSFWLLALSPWLLSVGFYQRLVILGMLFLATDG